MNRYKFLGAAIAFVFLTTGVYVQARLIYLGGTTTTLLFESLSTKQYEALSPKDKDRYLEKVRTVYMNFNKDHAHKAERVNIRGQVNTYEYRHKCGPLFGNLKVSRADSAAGRCQGAGSLSVKEYKAAMNQFLALNRFCNIENIVDEDDMDQSIISSCNAADEIFTNTKESFGKLVKVTKPQKTTRAVTVEALPKGASGCKSNHYPKDVYFSKDGRALVDEKVSGYTAQIAAGINAVWENDEWKITGKDKKYKAVISGATLRICFKNTGLFACKKKPLLKLEGLTEGDKLYIERLNRKGKYKINTFDKVCLDGKTPSGKESYGDPIHETFAEKLERLGKEKSGGIN